MKNLLCTMVLAFGFTANAQEALSYDALLANTSEVTVIDSLVLDSGSENISKIDSLTMRKWFSAVLSSGPNKFKNKTYYLIGKITTNENFDLVMVQEEKRKNDTVSIRVTYLVSTKKNGDYIASLKAVVNGTRKKTGYNISSCLYKGNMIVQDSRIVTAEESFNDMTHYKINSGGRFILQ
jgi:hypothetical protein